jgi:hypothetical protein
MTTTTLFRPVGVQELRLVPESAAPEARLPGAAARGGALSVLVDVWPFADLPLPSGHLTS